MAAFNELTDFLGRNLSNDQTAFHTGVGFGRGTVISHDKEFAPLCSIDDSLLEVVADRLAGSDVYYAFDEDSKGAFLIGAVFGAVRQVEDRRVEGVKNV